MRSARENQCNHELEHDEFSLALLDAIRLCKRVDRLRIQRLSQMLSQFVAGHRRLRSTRGVVDDEERRGQEESRMITYDHQLSRIATRAAESLIQTLMVPRPWRQSRAPLHGVETCSFSA
jgi:hypothetical protein